MKYQITKVSLKPLHENYIQPTNLLLAHNWNKDRTCKPIHRVWWNFQRNGLMELSYTPSTVKTCVSHKSSKLVGYRKEHYQSCTKVTSEVRFGKMHENWGKSAIETFKIFIGARPISGWIVIDYHEQQIAQVYSVTQKLLLALKQKNKNTVV